MAGTVYLADTSVWVLRDLDDNVRQRFDALLLSGRLAACHITAWEYLNIAPDPKTYKAVHKVITGQRWIEVTTKSMDRALEVHATLGSRSQHRNFSFPDLIIAATAELNGATVLHYDADYDRIAEITGQPMEWVAPRGSLTQR